MIDLKPVYDALAVYRSLESSGFGNKVAVIKSISLTPDGLNDAETFERLVCCYNACALVYDKSDFEAYRPQPIFAVVLLVQETLREMGVAIHAKDHQELSKLAQRLQGLSNGFRKQKEALEDIVSIYDS